MTSLLHLVDRAERGALLPAEAQQLRDGIRALLENAATHAAVRPPDGPERPSVADDMPDGARGPVTGTQDRECRCHNRQGLTAEQHENDCPLAADERRKRYACAVWELGEERDPRDHLLLHHPAVDAAMAVADAEIVEALRRMCDPRDHDALTEMRATIQRLRAEVTRLRAGEEPGYIKYTEATPGQWIWLWNHATPEERLAIVERVRDADSRAHRCILGNHEGQIEDLRHRAEQAEAANARVRHLATLIAAGAPWLSNHRNTANRIHAALNTPAPADTA